VLGWGPGRHGSPQPKHPNPLSTSGSWAGSRHFTGWSKGLDVTAGGEGIVSHAGLALLRQLADMTGLTGGLSHALASQRLLVHDRGPGDGRPGLRDR
jgi:hypothetical protein